MKTLSTLLTAGIPIAEALALIQMGCEHPLLKKTIQICHRSVMQGQQLHRAIAVNTFFLPLIKQMIKVGEESGSLESMLEKTIAFYETEIDYSINNFTRLLEPLIIMILGVLIGGIIIALYLPLFQLGTIA